MAFSSRFLTFFWVIAILVISSCSDQTADPEDVVDEYLSYSTWIGQEGRLNSIIAKKQLSSGIILKSLTNEESFLRGVKRLTFDFEAYCRQVSPDVNQCGAFEDDWYRDPKRTSEVQQKVIIEKTDDSAKIKVKRKIIFEAIYSGQKEVNETIEETIFILKKKEGYWKIDNFIDETGKTGTDADLDKEKKQYDSNMAEIKKIIPKAKASLDQLVQDYESQKAKEPIQVDYITYDIISAESFTRMGSSFLEKKTTGKFVKVTLKITNKAKETKEIFTPRFTIEDNKGRKFDMLSDGTFYIDNGLQLGMQLQPDLTVTGSIVFELPADAEGLVLVVRGDWLSNSEVRKPLPAIKKIGRETSQQDKLDRTMEDVQEQAEEQVQELLNQCNAPFSCSSTCSEYADVGQKDCPSGEVCCLQ